jgi:aspartate/methionine/tyrosine aminotransferase
MKTADRLEGIGEYHFSQKLREIEVLNQQGKAVINLGIGSPDTPPHDDVLHELKQQGGKDNVHAYQSYKGVAALREAIASWYRKWYDVGLDAASQILPLMGSKEGIMHICMTYLNAGDQALIPNPGYPTYRSAVKLAGGTIVEYELTEKNNWFPDLDALEKTDLKNVKLMWVNYPHMPTGQLPTEHLFQQLVDFGKRNGILICHDNPYSFILNDHPMSILKANGAMETAIELNSLSKSHNMAGWRIGMLCGAKERIEEVLRFKSNMDSGMFLPLQLAAVKGLALDENWHDALNDLYRQRRDKIYQILDLLHCHYSKQQAGLFVWAKVPQTAQNGFELSDQLLQEASVFITPGGIFGSAGDSFVRASLCSPVDQLELAIQRIKTSSKASS